MHRPAFGDVELDYEISGAGEPIVLVHHGAGRNWFGPLLEEPVLVDRYCVLRYHRAGYGPAADWPGR
jgi:pimeloyl-ACP methyl ester carboxylesterase